VRVSAVSVYFSGMSEHHARIAWSTAAAPADFVKGRYSREHTWAFDGGITVAGSSSPSVVPLPWSSAAAIDPEEAFVAAIASCHMLSFLYVAMKRGFAVARYLDDAVGTMAKTERGAHWVNRVTLSPRIEWAGERRPSAEELAELHHGAHEECFIANSVKTEIVVAH
jgi:organic hydroperoxide reductase OsmC/OhrA